MRIAITVWENRISPVFDVATRILLAEIQNGRVFNRQFIPFDPGFSWRLAEMLKEMGVSILICGAISKVPANIISAGGIKLMPFISGETEQILDAYAKGNPIFPAFSMPGIGKHCRRRGNRLIYFIQQKGVTNMPRGDGTGPAGQGAGTGKGRGGCKTGTGGQAGQGRGLGRGQGRRGGQGKGQGQGQNQGQGQSGKK
jgi:predicted Fe-Mo cluster-binding NifX family protein